MNLVVMVKPLTIMLKKNLAFSWNKEGKAYFEEIKQAISQDPTPVNLDYEKDFILYTFGGEPSISIVLTQLNDKNLEHPIAFFSEGLKDYELKYNYVEKQVLTIVRALNKFRHMLSNNKTQLLFPHANIKDCVFNKDMNEKRDG